MTVDATDPNVSEDSKDIDYNMSLENIYRRKYHLLLERCEVLEQDNERIINRVRQVEKITRQRLKDVKLIMERLDRHGDAYKKACIPQVARRQSEQGLRAPGRPYRSRNFTPVGKVVKENRQAIKRKRIIKCEKDKDPNAPKKPCNAFFQFCQEQRPKFIAETAEGPELTKKEVTKQLASKWRSLSTEDKKVYVAMFEKSKEKYAQEMSVYIRKDQT